MELRRSFQSGSSPLRERLEALAKAPSTTSIADIAELLAERAIPGATCVIGVTGSVAAGKTTFANAIAGQLRSTHHIEVVSTDGFMLSDEVLAARGLTLRRGYPETYDRNLLSGALQRVRWGAVHIPGYSQRTRERAPELDRTISRPDILLVEGLGLGPGIGGRSLSSLLDVFIYLDASEQDLEAWFVKRFIDYCRAADSTSRPFDFRFLPQSPEQAEALARSVWADINLPNLRDHIRWGRGVADIVVRKAADHSLSLLPPES